MPHLLRQTGRIEAVLREHQRLTTYGLIGGNQPLHHSKIAAVVHLVTWERADFISRQTLPVGPQSARTHSCKTPTKIKLSEVDDKAVQVILYTLNKKTQSKKKTYSGFPAAGIAHNIYF